MILRYIYFIDDLCDQFLHYNRYIVPLRITTEEYLLMIGFLFLFSRLFVFVFLLKLYCSVD